MMIGSVNYAGVNVRVWYMFTGSVQPALEIFKLENLLGGRCGEFSHLIILIRQVLF